MKGLLMHVTSIGNAVQVLTICYQSGGRDKLASRSHVDVLCFDLVYFTKPAQFIILSAGVFFFYLLYGYYQELIFSLPGFSGYGWYLTLIQFGYYSIFGKVGCCFLSKNFTKNLIFFPDWNVFETRAEESATENIHISCLDNCSYNGVFQC